MIPTAKNALIRFASMYADVAPAADCYAFWKKFSQAATVTKYLSKTDITTTVNVLRRNN